MSEQPHKDARGSQGYRNDSGYKSNQYPRQGQSSTHQAYYQSSSHRPSSGYNSSYHNNYSSYRQGSSRPSNKDLSYSQQSYNIGSDRYSQISYHHTNRNDNYHHERDQRKHEHTSGYGSRYNQNDNSYGKSYDYKSSSREPYNKDTKQPVKPYETSNAQPMRKHSNEQQRSRSRNKQYNKSYKDSTYQSSYHKPYYKDSKPYESRSSQYNDKPHNDYHKYKDMPTKVEKTQLDISTSKKSQEDHNDKYKETTDFKQPYQTKQPNHKQDSSKPYDKFKPPYQSHYQSNYNKTAEPYLKQRRSFKQTPKEPIESKDLLSIQIKSRNRSPRQNKHKKERNSSQSKSLSRSKKSQSKRKQKKRNSSGSSSSSSSNSSSSSSSSSRSSSSSSSGSSSSSNSRSVSSKSRKNERKEHKDFYQRKDQYQRPGYYQSSYNQAYQRDRPYNNYYNKPSFSSQNAIDQKDSSYQFKKQEVEKLDMKGSHSQQDKKQTVKASQFSNKDLRVSSIKATQQKNIKMEGQDDRQKIKAGQGEKQVMKKSESPQKVDIQEVTKPTSYNESRYAPYNRDLGQRDFYKKSYNGNYQPRQPYYQKLYYNQPYNQKNTQPQQFGSQNNIQAPTQNNTTQPNPTLPHAYQSYQNNETKPFNSYQPNQLRRNYSTGYDNTERKPYFNQYHQNNSYQPGPHQSGPHQPYLQNRSQQFTHYPYHQRFNQPYQNRSFERNYSLNHPTQTNPESNPNNPLWTDQTQTFNQQQPYHSYAFRRTTSEVIGERRPPYYAQSNDNDINKTQTFRNQTQDLAALQLALKRQSDLKKIHSLIPSSKVLELIEKARKNLTVPAIKSTFLTLQVFKEMSNIKKQTMNQNLKNILHSDYEKKYEEQKKNVFENLRLLNLESQTDENHQNNQNGHLHQLNPVKPQHNCQKMLAEQQEQKENPEIVKNKLFLWKKPQMSQNLRVLKSNMENMRKATSLLSEMSRKMKMKFDQSPVPGSERSALESK